MRFLVRKASDFDDKSLWDFSTIEELMCFIEAYGSVIITDSEIIYDGEKMSTIILYDANIEQK